MMLAQMVSQTLIKNKEFAKKRGETLDFIFDDEKSKTKQRLQKRSADVQTTTFEEKRV